MEPRYPEVYVPLSGMDGNAVSIMGRTMEALRRGHVPREEIEAYVAEATGGDYDHVIQTTLLWVNEGEAPKPRPVRNGPVCPACGSEDYYPDSVGCRACLQAGLGLLPDPYEGDEEDW